MPPQYDDLDLPPSYTTLFPGDEGRYTSITEEEVREEVEAVPSCSSDAEKNDLNQSGHSVQIETTTVQINCSETGSDASQEEVTPESWVVMSIFLLISTVCDITTDQL